MKNIILTVSYGSRTDCLTITQKTTWSDLCASIFDYSRLPVTQLYYRDREGDIIAFSSDDELNSLKQCCTTGWLHLSTDPTNTIRWVLDDSFVNQKGDFEQQSIPTNRYPTSSTSTPTHSSKASPKTLSINNITTTSFASQFEQFGKLMDKYNDLVQQDEQVKALMHQTATEITLQQPEVNLAELENRLANYKNQGTSTNALYPLGSKPSSDSLDNASINLSRSATSVTPRRRNIKRTPTASLYHNYDNSNDQSWITPTTTSYTDVPPPSYETHHQPDENEKRKREQRRHTHYGNFDHRQSFPSSSWGEWPAYSSLNPRPPPSLGTNDTISSSSPSPTASAPKLHDTLPTSTPSLAPNSPQHHHHHHHHHHHAQRPPMSLYPRPPILPALLKRTSRLLSHWVPPLASPAPSSPPGLPSTGTALRSTSAMNDRTSYNENDYDDNKQHTYTSNGDDGARKQKGKQHDDTGRMEDQLRYSDPATSTRHPQMYKEQQRILRQQQKELARTRRRLKRQEKKDRKEYRRQRRQDRQTHSTATDNNHSLHPQEQNDKSLQHERRQRHDNKTSNSSSRYNGQRAISSSYGVNASSLRKSSSLSSISSLSSQSTISSTYSSDSSSSSSSSPPTLEKSQQQQSSGLLDHHTATLQYPTIPASITQHLPLSQPPSSSNNDHRYGRRFHHGDNAGEDNDQSLDGHDIEYLANTFNQLSTTNADPPSLVPWKQ